MAYNDDEISNTGGSPNELYEFLGTYNSYFITSSMFPINSGGRLYLPVAVKRNRLKVSTQDNTDANLEIEMPFDHPMIKEYAYENAPPNLSVKIRRCHRTNFEDTILLWNGRVTGFSVAGRLAKLKVPAIFGYILEGNTPTPRFQAPCNHVLYDARCGVNPASHQFVTTIVSINNNNVTVASLPFAANEAAAGIMITPSGESRMIVSNVGTSVVLSYSFAGAKIGDSVTIRKGCDHSLEGHCKTRFANGARFGGFPLVPPRNPFTSTLE